MSKNDRIKIKLILIVFGILFLTMVSVVKVFKMQKIIQKEGENVKLEDVMVLTTKLCPMLAQDDEAMELLRTAQADPEQNINYEQYLKLRERMRQAEQAPEEDFWMPLLNKEYEKEYLLVKKDWEAIFALFQERYNKDGRLTVERLTILDFTERDGKGLVRTEQEEIPYAAHSFLQYRYQSVDAYTMEGELLAVKEVSDPNLTLRNVWIMENDSSGITFFSGGYEGGITSAEMSSGSASQGIEREQVADLFFSGGKLKKGQSKMEKKSGRIMSLGQNRLELEREGAFEIASDCRIYRLYGSLEEVSVSDLVIGYDFTDFVIEDGKVCAGLIMKEEAMENIRVLLKTSSFSDIYHDKVEVTADCDFVVRYGKDGQETEEYAAGEKVIIDKKSAFLDGQRAYIEPKALSGKLQLLSVGRTQGNPRYRGILELKAEKQGIVVVNEVMLEEYLYSVVPSEMPSSYPFEALKAQAVCARTYAYAKMLHSPLAQYGAHVDDSTSYQVYNNIEENVETTRAVKETSGRLLAYGEEPAAVYYYSTSCGFGTTADVWKGGNSAELPYLQSKNISAGEQAGSAELMAQEETFCDYISETQEQDFEAGEGWYRWNYTVEKLDVKGLRERLQVRYEANPALVLTENGEGGFESKPVKDLGKIRELYVEKRNAGGVADELIIEGEKSKVKVISEYNIRYVLSNGEAKVIRQDGSEIDSPVLLPSAFMTIAAGKEGEDVIGYTITGGGYGHGVGMSQNGAKAMAAQGWDCDRILTFFYEGSTLEKIY